MRNLLLVALSVVAILSGCKKDDDTPYSGGSNDSDVIVPDVQEPIADFTYEIKGKFAPLEVEFDNLSENAETFSWDFGDGSSFSEDKYPQHEYESGGTYTVTLVVKGEGGSDRISKTINIPHAPTKLQINNLILRSFPTSNDDGGNWDFTGGPDIYWKIMDEDLNTTYFTSGKIKDLALKDLPVAYTNGLPILVNNLNKTYTIVFYDADSPDDDDYMGGYYFKPFAYTNYASTIEFYTSDNDEIKFSLNVLWSNNRGEKMAPNSKVQRIELEPIDKNTFKNFK